jgi:predicted PurR-regulated permease PerM
MMDMMQNCWNWMMSFGVVGMLLGIVVLVLLIALLVALIRRLMS